jgi:HlyD family secretion protein
MAKAVIGIAGVAVVAGAAFGLWRLNAGAAEPKAVVPLAEVRAADLLLTVTSEGKLKPKEYITIKPRVETINELTLLQLVPNGTVVKPGDLLVAFDTADLVQAISKLKIDVQAAESELVQAKEEVRKAELDQKLNIRDKAFKLMLAGKELEKYKDLDGPKQIKESEMKRSRAEAELEEATKNHQEALEMKKEDLVAENEVKKAELRLREAEYALESARLSHDLLVKYTVPIENQRLKQTLEDAQEQMESIKPYTESIVSQKKAGVNKAERALNELRDQLAKKEKDLQACEIKAPAAGMIHYGAAEGRHWHNSDRETLKVGNKVNNHDSLMYIPDLSTMYLDVLVDEVDISKIRKGQRITAHAEAHPAIAIAGVVEEVGQVASQEAWWETQIKFRVRCALDQSLEWFRPDLTARVEVAVGDLKGVTVIPVDAVFQRDGKTVCYLEDGTARPVTLGPSTSEAVQVKEGLRPGEKVRLTAPAAK